MPVASLSPSRAGDFTTCPLLFRYRTVDRLPESTSPAAVRGTLVHRVLEQVFDLTRHEGLCIGGSAGINVAAAIAVARQMGPGHRIVTILCDGGARYQSKLFNPDFLRGKNLPVPPWLA